MRNNYAIEIKTGKRMAGGVLEGCEMYEVEYTQYNILRDGQLVGFVFDADDINTAIDTMERFPNQNDAIRSRFD